MEKKNTTMQISELNNVRIKRFKKVENINTHNKVITRLFKIYCSQKKK